MNHCVRLFQSLPKQFARTFSSKLPSELVVFMDDNMVVCWHPEQPFPYEYSKPLPKIEKKPDTSVLKIGQAEIKAVFHREKEELIPEELARITYTTKHRWYPRCRDNRQKKFPSDRRYL